MEATANMVKKKQKVQKKAPDYLLLGLIILLVGFGIIMVYSASYYYATTKGWASTSFVQKQILMVAIGFLAMYVTYKFNYRFFIKGYIAVASYIGSLVMCLAVISPLGIERNGARRWLNIPGIPFDIQPSEFVKVAVILMVTWWLIKYRENLYAWQTKLVAWIMVALPAVLVTWLCSDLSSGLVIAAVGGVIIVAASRCRSLVFYALGLILLGIGIFGLRNIAVNTPPDTPTGNPVIDKVLTPYRMARIRAWVDPSQDPTDEGYQTMQALNAVGSGGLFGVGLSNGVQKLGFLPEPYNDIIFAVICEELGLAGAFVLILTYVIIVLKGFGIAMQVPDDAGAYLAIGISSMVGIQALINIAVNINVLPATGMQLPLISYGGTAIIVLLATLGILLNISRQ